LLLGIACWAISLFNLLPWAAGMVGHTL
jgi:hypothetical protein